MKWKFHNHFLVGKILSFTKNENEKKIATNEKGKVKMDAFYT